MKYNADGSITFTPSTSAGVITPDQLKALQDEVKKLQDMLSVRQGGAEHAKLQAQIDALKKEVDDNKAATNKNFADLIGIIETNQKAIEMLHKKQSAAPKREPESIKPPTKQREPGTVEVVVKLPPALEGAVVYMDGKATASHGATRTFITAPLPTDERYVFDVTAVASNNTTVRRRISFHKNETVVADFTRAP